MTKSDLLKGYMKYIRMIPSIKGSVSNYSPAIKKLPFDYIEIVMSKWEVKENNGKYEEHIINHPATRQSCDKRTYNLWRYYKENIEPVVSGGSTYDYLQLISDFIDHNDIVYALSIIDIMTGIAELANRYKNEYNSKMKKINPRNQIIFSNSTRADYFSKCRKALKFMLEWAELNKSFIQNVIPSTRLDSIRKTIVKSLIYKIDGAKALAKEIGVDKFIQYAIDQSYFFEPVIVVGQAYTLAWKLTNGTVVDARSSENKAIQDTDPVTGQMTFYDSSFNPPVSYPIDINNDKNSPVRNVIKDKTGYSVSEGAESQFQNYRISHIWGKAYDPRYFTNLWNVALVPAWANDLLDKPNPIEGSLESKLKSTIQRICEVLYFGMITNWSTINIFQPNVINRDKNGNDDRVWPKTMENNVKPKMEINKENASKSKNAPVGPLPYLINVIERKKGKGKSEVGDIVKYAVYI